MKFAYADPPYLGQGKKHYAKNHPDAGIWDTLEAHKNLIQRLVVDFPDGWALSASSPSLWTLLPMCPQEVRVAAWVKPFASFKPNVNPAYTWEPVLFMGGRKGDRTRPTVRDFHSANITLKKGLTGVKPDSFCFWIFDLLGCEPEDEFHDLFPGSGAVTKAWHAFQETEEVEG
jgi:hypothetical protein